MQLFFTTNITTTTAELGVEELRHLQVLRKKIGDRIHLLNGEGSIFEAEITNLQKKRVSLNILSEKNHAPPSFSLHVAIAPTKNISRFEWFLEKATEIGIQEITPIFCDHSERKNIRLDRLEKIVLSAMKQSQRTYLPKLYPAIPFSQLIVEQQGKSEDLRYIAHCAEDDKVQLVNNYQARRDVFILIGPEGDFSSSEITYAIDKGFLPISLGETRLRTETAGVVACHTIQLLNQMAS